MKRNAISFRLLFRKINPLELHVVDTWRCLVCPFFKDRFIIFDVISISSIVLFTITQRLPDHPERKYQRCQVDTMVGCK